MATKWQNWEVNVSGGLDTKTDRKVVEPGSMLALENGIFTTTGQIKKRYGSTQLPQTIVTGGTLSEGAHLQSYRDELLALTSETPYTWSPNNNTWRDIGTLSTTNCQTSYRDLHVDNGNDMSCTVGYINNIIIVFYFSYDAGTNTFNYYADYLDATTQAFIVQRELIDTMTAAQFATYIIEPVPNPKVVTTLLGSIFLVYMDGARHLRVKFKLYSTLTTAAVSIVDTGDINHAFFDCIRSSFTPNTRAILAFGNSTSNGINVVDIDSSGVLSTNTFASLESRAITVCSDSTGRYYLVYMGPGSMRDIIINNSFIQLVADKSMGLVGGSGLCSIEQTAAAPNGIYVFFSSASTHLNVSPTTALTYSLRESPTGVTTAGPFALRAGFVASTPFAQGGQRHFALVAGQTGTLTAYLTQIGIVCSRALSGSVENVPLEPIAGVGGAVERLMGQSAEITGTGKYLVAFITTKAPNGRKIALVQYDFSRNYAIQSAPCGEDLYVNSGLINQYDGQLISEEGFNYFPFAKFLARIAVGGALSDGTYSFAFIYSYLNSNGEIVRSAPSNFIRQTFTAGTATQSITFDISSMLLSYKAAINIECYRTTNGGSTFYFESSTRNDTTTANTGVVGGTVSDADIASNIPLYTTGGRVPYFPCPSANYTTVFNNRIFAIVNGTSLFFSNAAIGTTPAQFSLISETDLTGSPEKLVALSSVDQNLIIFSSTSIFAITGDGPNDFNVGSFSAPYRVSTDVGCSDPQSVIRTASGVIFKSSKGFYLLDRSLAVSYIGGPVEAYNSYIATSAILEQDTQQVRFSMKSGATYITLIYDYLFNKWGKNPEQNYVSRCVFQGREAGLVTNGTVRLESNIYQDNGVSYTLFVSPGWIHLAGIAGWNRIRRFIVTGEKYSNHSLVIDVYYDYNDTVVETFTFSAADLSIGGRYQFRQRLGRQKCEAIRFTFRGIDQEAPYSAYGITSLSLELGILTGLYRRSP